VLRDAGVAAPIDNEIRYYVLIGAASLPYVNAPEVRLLTGRDPIAPPGSTLTLTGWFHPPARRRHYFHQRR
jgi:hypothetical protein